MNSGSSGAMCAYCGASNPETHDHIPPKGLFSPPLPPDLITVPCCARCHTGTSRDELTAAVSDVSVRGLFAGSFSGRQGHLSRLLTLRSALSSSLVSTLPSFAFGRATRTSALGCGGCLPLHVCSCARGSELLRMAFRVLPALTSGGFYGSGHSIPRPACPQRMRSCAAPSGRRFVLLEELDAYTSVTPYQIISM